MDRDLVVGLLFIFILAFLALLFIFGMSVATHSSIEWISKGV